MAESGEDLREELSAFARTVWAAALVAASQPSTAPISYENNNFNPPADGSLWARLTIKNTDGDRVSLGKESGLFRREGLVTLQIFIPIGSSTFVADQLADSIVEAFEDAAAIGNIWFRNTTMREVGPDGTFHQVNVVTQYVYDRTA